MVKNTEARWMVKDTIDRNPKYVFHLPDVQNILLWLFQYQDDPTIQKMYQNTKQCIKSQNVSKNVSKNKKTVDFHRAGGRAQRGSYNSMLSGIDAEQSTKPQDCVLDNFRRLRHM